MNDLPDTLTRLEARLETLEQRVYLLEHGAAAPLATAAPAATVDLATTNAVGNANLDEKLATSPAGGVFPVLGKAMLGIAGAYLLRAVAESGALPNAAVAAVAIAYALGWLVWASRVKAGEWLAGSTYASTSAMILAPMLWELTLRFNVLPAWATAAVLGGFALAATALAWKRGLAPVLWVANGTVVASSLALAIATHQIGPFIAVLLLMVLVGEYAAARGRATGVRVMVALAADFAIWVQIYIYAGPESARTAYPPLSSVALLAPGIALFLILGGGLVYRTASQGKIVTVFETIEITIAFLLGVSTLGTLGPPSGMFWLGVFCLLLSAIGYAVTFLRFDRAAERRNYLVSITWSGALLLAGSLLSLPQTVQASWLSVAAVAAIYASARLNRLALEVQGMAFLLAAAWVSGLLSGVSNSLAGVLPSAPGVSLYVVSAGAVACYAAIKPCTDQSWTRSLLSIAFAVMAMGVLAAYAVQGLASIAALKVIVAAHHVAFIRTLTVCAAAIALAYSGAHWRRMELTRVGYATLVLVAVKLVFEDLRHGHLAFIAGSIFVFAITLMVVPRVARMGQRV